jgi:hypothetical protein
MTTRWTLTLEEDPDTKELILPFTQEILNTVGWKEGDVIVWKKNNNGTWTLKKKVDKTKEKSV